MGAFMGGLVVFSWAITRVGHDELRPPPCFVSSRSACLFLRFSVIRDRKVLTGYLYPDLDLQPVDP